MSMENQLIQIANIRHASGEVICDIQKLKVKFYRVDYTSTRCTAAVYRV